MSGEGRDLPQAVSPLAGAMPDRAEGSKTFGDSQVQPQATTPSSTTPSSTAPRPEDAVDVLVCEDNEVNQIVFSQILTETGYSFAIANNGREGVSLYERLQPKLILMDVSMPQMNGLEATAAIRKAENESTKHTPIVGVTAHAIKGDQEKCFEAGMDDYLAKPVSPDALTQKIDKWMQMANNNSRTG